MKFAAIGRTHWLLESARAVAARGHQLALVVTAAARPEYQSTEKDFAALAREHGCRFFDGIDINTAEVESAVAQSGADIAISVNYPTLIGGRVRAKFRHGVLNAHAGELPRFRGNACPNWAILAGEPHVVVTIHQMADELDAGPILLQRACPLTDTTYIADVYAFMEQNIPPMFADAVEGLAAGTMTMRQQASDPAAALRCYPRRPDDGFLDWTQPAQTLSRIVRASAEPFAGAFFIRGGSQVIVWRAHAAALRSPVLGVPGQVLRVAQDTGHVDVLTGDGVMVLEELQVEGGARSRAAAVVRSTAERLGFDAVGEYLKLARRLGDLEKR